MSIRHNEVHYNHVVWNTWAQSAIANSRSRDKTPIIKSQHPKPKHNKCSPQPQNPNHKSQWHFIHWRFAIAFRPDTQTVRLKVILHFGNFANIPYSEQERDEAE